MAAGDNAESQWGFGEEKMQKEESVNVRTVDCLRGRLLAERTASRNAKEEADMLGNKMMELEKLLEQEAKSRKRAEKRLKHLMKKLESLSITYTSDESSVSSLASLSTTKEVSDNYQIKVVNANVQPNDISSWSSSSNEASSCSSAESEITRADEDHRPPSITSEIFEQNIAAEEGSSSCDTHCNKSSQVGSIQSHNDYYCSKVDGQSESVKSFKEEGINQDDDDDDDDDGVDNSMALVPVEVQQKLDRIDPQVLDNTVKEVLDALKYAKEQLQSSMERQRRNRNLIKVG